MSDAPKYWSLPGREPAGGAATHGRTVPAAPALGPGSRLSGRYRLTQLLGRGGMGEVYEALDEELSIRLALKALRPETWAEPAALWRLKREVLLARAIAHPHVCRVYDLGRGEHAGQPLWFLTMELLRGENLQERLVRLRRLSFEEALRVAVQMAAGLGAAHRAGVVHRDFKSSNVMLDGKPGQERAVVTDFGLARPSSEEFARQSGTRVTDSEMVLGTPAYMAPEQVRGEKAGPAADVYSLGIVLYEMLTGRMPFSGETPMELMRRRLDEDPPPPRTIVPDLPEPWEAVVLRCLERDPGSRFECAEDVAQALSGNSLAAAGVTPGEIPAQHSLPEERDAFVGRQAELSQLSDVFARGSRLLTLVGPAGMGKTRLALRYGWESLHEWPGGVWFCDLTDAREPGDIAGVVAGAMGVPLIRGNPLEQLGHAIAVRGRCLLVLDNFEQLVEHGEVSVGSWLKTAKEASFLVTSRERLNLPGEEVRLVEPLGQESGVDLFQERARRQHPGLDLAPSELESAREVVKMVEGMPLAIELAAARMRVMSAKQIVERMRDRFRLLGGAKRGRHATLKAAIDGSWDLLQPWERSALAQCSVFEGGFTLEAAEAVLDLTEWPEAAWVVDVVQSLVDKSLLRMWVPEQGAGTGVSEARFVMYVSIQEYARERLRENGSGPGADGVPVPAGAVAVEERHGRWYARYGEERAIRALLGDGGAERRTALHREYENLVAACRRAVAREAGDVAATTYRAAWTVLEQRGPAVVGVELGRSVLAAPLSPGDRAGVLAATGRMALRAGFMDEARTCFESALRMHLEAGDEHAEGVLLGDLGSLNLQQGRVEVAHEFLDRSLVLHRKWGDRHGEAQTLRNLGVLHAEQGRTEEARSCYEQALQINHELADPSAEAVVRVNLANLHREQGRMEEARELYEAALEINRAIGDLSGEGLVLANLGNLHQEQGCLAEARAYFQTALETNRQVGYRRFEGNILGNLGLVLFEQGLMEDARACYEKALEIHREAGNRRSEAYVLGNLGNLHLRQGQMTEAGELLRRGEAQFREVGDRLELGKLLCFRAELERAKGDEPGARATLAEASAIAIEVGAGPHSELGQALAKLGQTLAAGRAP